MSEFALCLTHDVDRPYKTYQNLYYAVKERSFYHLRTLLFRENPYWQFEEIMALERDLGVRSSFYFLNGPGLFQAGSLAEFLDPKDWLERVGRYDITADPIVEVIRRLDAEGWEVGMHGSYRSCDDIDRLRTEKRELESILGHEVLGSRQHHLKRTERTWEYHRELGFAYDSSIGSSSDYGFQHGYDPYSPFDDEFTVFPLTLMEVALPDPGEDFDAAWAECERLLDEAEENDAVMTALWHPRYFSEDDFPGYRRLYVRLVEEALERGAWVGPIGEYYQTFLESETTGRDESDSAVHNPSSRPDSTSNRRSRSQQSPGQASGDTAG